MAIDEELVQGLKSAIAKVHAELVACVAARDEAVKREMEASSAPSDGIFIPDCSVPENELRRLEDELALALRGEPPEEELIQSLKAAIGGVQGEFVACVAVRDEAIKREIEARTALRDGMFIPDCSVPENELRRLEDELAIALREPLDLNGTWLDNGRKVTIRQDGSSVLAKYVEDYECKYADNAQPAKTRDDFTGALSESERLLTGETTACDWGTGSHTGKGIIWTPMKLRVSADSERLEGKFCLRGVPKSMTLSTLYSKIEVRLRTFAPSPAVSVLPKHLMVPHFSIFGVDNRGFSYRNGTHRSMQNLVVTADPAVDIPGPTIGNFGSTKQYSNVQGTQDSDRWWWWNINPGEEPLFTNTLTPTAQNNLVTVKRLGSDTIRVTFMVEAKLKALEPMHHLSWSITARINVDIKQKEGEEAWYRVEGYHDGFPAYELYVNAVRVYGHDPLIKGETPLSLFSTGSGEWTVKIPLAPQDWELVPGKRPIEAHDMGEVDLQCPPKEEDDKFPGFLRP